MEENIHYYLISYQSSDKHVESYTVARIEDLVVRLKLEPKTWVVKTANLNAQEVYEKVGKHITEYGGDLSVIEINPKNIASSKPTHALEEWFNYWDHS